MFEQQYKNTFDQVVASRDTVQEVLNLKTKQRKKFRLTTLAAAVLLICLLATTAFAYTGFVVYENPGQMMQAFFGNGDLKNSQGKIYEDEYGQTIIWPAFQREELDQDAVQTYVAPHTFAVGKSVSEGNNTMTVEAYTYDADTRCGLVYLHLEMPEGLPAHTVAENGQLIWQGPEIIYSHDVIVEFYVDRQQSGNTTMTLAGYFYLPDYYQENTVTLYLNQGRWDNNPQLEFSLDTTGDMDIITAGSGGIVLAPFSIVVYGDRLGMLTESMETNPDYVEIRYADGTSYVVCDETGEIYMLNYANAIVERGKNSDGYETDRYCATYLLNRVVSLDNVKEIVVDGTVYPVD